MDRSRKQKKSKKQRVLTEIRGSLPVMLTPGFRLGSRKAVPKIYVFDLPITPITFSVVAGALAQATAVGNGAGYFPRVASFNAIFAENRLIGCRFRIKVTTPFTTPQGYTSFYINEKLSSAPTANEAQSAPHIEIPHLGTSNDQNYYIDWVARDLNDLGFTQSGTTFISFYLKGLAAGTAAGTAGTFTVDGVFRMQYRGFQ